MNEQHSARPTETYCVCGKSQSGRRADGRLYCKTCGKDYHPDNFEDPSKDVLSELRAYAKRWTAEEAWVAAGVVKMAADEIEAALKRVSPGKPTDPLPRVDCYSWLAQWKGEQRGWVSLPGNFVRYEDYLALEASPAPETRRDACPDCGGDGSQKSPYQIACSKKHPAPFTCEAELTEARAWIASLMTHMEDNWRGIDEGPIQRARAYLTGHCRHD